MTRFFDGQYASADCVLPEHATRALLPLRVQNLSVLVRPAPREVRIFLSTRASRIQTVHRSSCFASDVDVQRRDARLEAQQLALF